MDNTKHSPYTNSDDLKHKRGDTVYVLLINNNPYSHMAVGEVFYREFKIRRASWWYGEQTFYMKDFWGTFGEEDIYTTPEDAKVVVIVGH